MVSKMYKKKPICETKHKKLFQPYNSNLKHSIFDFFFPYPSPSSLSIIYQGILP